MPKLKMLSGRELCALLAQYGYVQIRQRGSHIIMQKSDAASTRTIPVPDHDEIRIGTLQSIIRQSQLPRKIFEA